MNLSNEMSQLISAAALNTTGRKAELAAVAYLNMLPFFVEDASVELFASPRSLNSSERECDAYCSSLISGLKSETQLLTSQVGIFSSGRVESVFIEPVVRSDAHAIFWKQIEEYWGQRNPDPLRVLEQTNVCGQIVLRSSGASEQSVWMLQILTALAGFRVEISQEHEGCSVDSSQDTQIIYPEARLWIGDPALERRLAFPNNYRIDLGHVWNSHIGHKAWFAGWFVGRDSAPEHQDLTEDLVTELRKRANAWTARSDFSRWCEVYKFLESRKSSLLKFLSENEAAEATQMDGIASVKSLPSGMNDARFFDDQHWDLRDVLTDYFRALEYTVTEAEGNTLEALYRQLHVAFERWEKKWSETEESHPQVALRLSADLFASNSHGHVHKVNAI